MSRTRLALGLAVAGLAFVAGCGHKKRAADPVSELPTSRSAIDTRIAAAGASWNRYSAEDQALIRRGDFRVGLDELALYIARGAPTIWWRTRENDELCNVLFYSTGTDGSADLAVLSCSRSIVRRAPITPAIPCSRLADFAPRMVAQASYFESLPLTRQWDLAIGALERGQSAADVALAYGKPYNTGSEVREDGSRATSLVFLDSAQEAYALTITLVDDKVVAWKIPAERVLTPQAQQRHAADAARQVAAEVRAADEQAAARYAEEARARNEAQANKRLLLDVAGAVATAAATQAIASQPQPQPASVKSSTKSSSSEKTLTINGCTYHESGGGALGQSCGTCPKGYLCSLFGSDIRSSGLCVPSNQQSACMGSGSRGKKR